MVASGPRADTRKPRSVEREWRWVEVMIASFVFTPELRRLIDWKIHFSSIDIVSPLPLLLLMPIAYFAFRNRGRLVGSPFVWVLIAWGVACGYAALSGFIQLAGMTALYGLAIYALPLAAGAWLITLDMPARDILARITRNLLLFGAISGIYGVFQFIVAPPWDTEWMINVNASSFGLPVPFGIRVFGTLNSPGTYASFIASTIILTVATVDLRKPWVLISVGAIFVGLVLSEVRTSWLEVLLGLAVILVLHPRRIRSFFNIAVLAGVSFVAISAFLAFSPDEMIRYTLTERVSTFQDVTEDGSALARAAAARGALNASLQNPQGIGLGATGPAAKLTPDSTSAFYYNADPAIDNGYISRFYEMGFFGFACFLVTMLLSLIIPFSAYRRATALGTPDDVATCVISIAFVIGTLGSLYGGDAIQGITGTLFFVVVAASSRVATELASGRKPAVGDTGSRGLRLRTALSGSSRANVVEG
jgi:hypothetical protein